MKKTPFSVMLNLFQHPLINIAMLFIPMSASAQIMFQRTYGGSGYDEGRCVKQTWDGGYIIAGSTSSFGAGSTDVYLLKVDSLGNPQWQKTFGGTNIDKGYSLEICPDSGFVICGYTNSFGNGGYDAYLIRTTQNGDSLWTKTYGGTDWDFAYSLKIIADTNIIVVGNSYSNSDFQSKAWAIFISMNGSVIWSKQYSIPNESFLNSVIQTQDSNFLAIGYLTGGINNSEDILLFKTNANGDSLWTRSYGNTGNDRGNSIDTSSAGGYILGATMTNITSGYGDFYLIKTDTSGNMQWNQEFVSTAGDYLYTIKQLSSAQYVTCGLSYGAGAGAGDVSLIWAGNFGAFDSSRSYGDAQFETPYCLNICNDKGFIIVGKTNSFNSNPEKVYLIKTDSTGLTDPNVVPSVGENISRNNNLRLFPNPANLKVYIDLSEHHLNLNSNLQIQIVDLTGRNLISNERHRFLQNSNIELSLESIPAGYYILTIDYQQLHYRGKLVIIK